MTLYITSDIPEYAERFKARLIALGCSEEYAESVRQDILQTAVQVSSPYEANMIQSGKVQR